jgi:hypothetical protein
VIIINTIKEKIIEEYNKGTKKNGELINEVIYRRLAFPLVLLAKSLHLTPNMVSIIGFIFTVLSGVFLALDNLILAAVMLFLRHVFDCADGSLARNLKLFSKIGAYFDAVCDTLGFIFVVVGFMIRYYSFTPNITSMFLLGLSLGFSQLIQVLAYDNFRGRFVKELDTYSGNTYEIFAFPEEEEKKKLNLIQRIANLVTKFYQAIAPIPKLSIPVDISQEEKVKIHKSYQKYYNQTFSIMHKLWSLVGGGIITTALIITCALQRSDLIWFTSVVILNSVLVVLIVIQNVVAWVFRRKVRDIFGMNVTSLSNPFTGRSIPI